MIQFIHTADIHFGVENYGKVDPKTGIHTRLLDFKESLQRCIDDALARRVDFFLFSGDAYKTAHPTPTQQKLLMQQLLRLYAARIPVIIVVGNHDHPLSFGKANALDVFAELPFDGFHVFNKPELLVLNTKSGPVQIVGVPWPTRNNVVAKDEHHAKKSSEITTYLSERVTQIINELSKEIDPSVPAVLCGHLTVSSGIFSGSEKCAVYGTDPIFLPSQLALPMYDYVALGHLHRYQDLNATGYPSVVYSGSIDRVDFGERKETKGYCVVSIATDSPPKPGEKHQYKTKGTHEFVPLQTRPFIQVEVKLEKNEPQTEQVLAALQRYEVADAIVKIVYHVPDGLSDEVDLNAVTRACSSAMYVVGIFPIRKPAVRARRLDFKAAAQVDHLLEQYLESREDLKPSKERLLQKAHALFVMEDDVER